MRFGRNSDAVAGFTVVELMVVVAIAAVLIVIAAPSFAEFLSKRRVDGVMSELVTDLQYARSEAVSRNVPVRVTFGADCYAIHLASASSAACTRTSKTISPPAAEIKTVQLEQGRPLTIDPGALNYFEFDPVRGTVVNSDASSSASVTVRSTSGTGWELHVLLTLMGRVGTCSPIGSGKVAGYASCS